jgi:large subunit ribosomal protein L13
MGVLFRRDPTKVVRLAIGGMLPKSTLKDRLLKRLHVFEGSEHPYSAQKPTPYPPRRPW